MLTELYFRFDKDIALFRKKLKNYIHHYSGEKSGEFNLIFSELINDAIFASYKAENQKLLYEIIEDKRILEKAKGEYAFVVASLTEKSIDELKYMHNEKKSIEALEHKVKISEKKYNLIEWKIEELRNEPPKKISKYEDTSLYPNLLLEYLERYKYKISYPICCLIELLYKKVDVEQSLFKELALLYLDRRRGYDADNDTELNLFEDDDDENDEKLFFEFMHPIISIFTGGFVSDINDSDYPYLLFITIRQTEPEEVINLLNYQYEKYGIVFLKYLEGYALKYQHLISENNFELVEKWIKTPRPNCNGTVSLLEEDKKIKATIDEHLVALSKENRRNKLTLSEKDYKDLWKYTYNLVARNELPSDKIKKLSPQTTQKQIYAIYYRIFNSFGTSKEIRNKYVTFLKKVFDNFSNTEIMTIDKNFRIRG